jgi:endoglucanase
VIAALLLALATAAEPCGGPVDWPHWRAYGRRFIEASGRVVDPAGGVTTSEGQAYALFLALVANDREQFDRVLRWTTEHLAGGDLARRLPAWKWGKKKLGSGVLDRNSASDADVWLGYALLEAGRLWSDPALDRAGRGVLALAAEREVATLGDLGPMLLPGPDGFELDRGKAWRLNPSYLPPPVLRRLASAGLAPWAEVHRGAIRTLRASSVNGLAPDWAVYRAGRGFGVDPVRGAVGSYDAIRVYLWIGMLHPEDPDRDALLETTRGLLDHLAEHGWIPDRLDVQRRAALGGRAPPGFLAALLPAARTSGDRGAATLLEAHLARAYGGDGLYGDPPAYYDQNLVLFGKGFAEGRYWFAPDGSLVPAWREQCDRP